MAQSAGFLLRAIAYLLDGLLIGVPLAVTGITIWGMTSGALLFIQCVTFFYFLLLPVIWPGHTVGKRMLGVRITKLSGENVLFTTMFLRWFVSGIIYMLTFGSACLISVIMIIVREDKRTIHDLIAGTTVTFKKRN